MVNVIIIMDNAPARVDSQGVDAKKIDVQELFVIMAVLAI